MKRLDKKILAGLALGGVMIFGGVNFNPVLAASTNALANVAVNQQGQINWNEGYMVAYGVGRVDKRGLAMVREAAVMAAQRNLVGMIKGLSIDSETTMRDLIIESDVVNRKITGVLKGAEVIDEGKNSDGSYYVGMRVSIYGADDSLAAAIIPEIAPEFPKPFETVQQTALPSADVENFRRLTYTGLVVDASNLGLSETFSPVIYDINGRAVYGLRNLDRDMVISNGMVDYYDLLQEATVGERTGANPLVVKALEVRGGKNSVNHVNVIVSVEDADRILLANENSHMLENCAVSFVR